MIPFKQHTAQLVEQIVETAESREKHASIPCYDNTIQNLRKWFDSIADELAKRLERLHNLPQTSARDSPLRRIRNALNTDKGWLRKIVAILVNSNYWITTRILC